MAKRVGWAGKLEVSGDGGITFYDVEELTSATVNLENETDDFTVLQDRGFKSEEPTVTGGSVSFEGFYNSNNDGQAILERRLIGKQSVIFKYYEDYRITSKYYIFKAYVNTFEKTHEAQGKVGFSAEGTVTGSINRIGY